METALSKLRECIDCEVVVVKDGKKTLDTKAAGILLRIFEMLDKRKMGDYEQKKSVVIENKKMGSEEIENSGVNIYEGSDIIEGPERAKELAGKTSGSAQTIEVSPTGAASE
jgi:hypothetical protein